MNALTRAYRAAAANSLAIAWTIATASAAASLYLSEVQHLVPCSLCWWQRICLYPLVLILGAGLLRRDRGVTYYALPLASIGALIAGYHSLIQWGIIPEAYAPCQAGISCGDVQVLLWGFATIPFGAFVSFVAIIAALVAWRRSPAADPQA